MEYQKKQVFASIHDSLGAQLTDITVLASRLGENPGTLEIQEQILAKARETARFLRSEIQNLEDHMLLDQDFFLGIQTLLLKRYSAAGRKIRMQIPHRSIEFAPAIKDALFFLFTEIATNDLKYGKGTSTWRITEAEPELPQPPPHEEGVTKSITESQSKTDQRGQRIGPESPNDKRRERNEDGRKQAFTEGSAMLPSSRLLIEMEAQTGYTLRNEGTGRGTANIQNRIAALHGSCQISLDGHYRLRAEIPVFGEG